ncbi:MAG TPA: putative baseplate assembly protein [Thermoanaerobaculia bacterium]|jgi:hypothetical protein|nr:putative baseplate assembly protein [Thermoanaerobaculia bacterium]
MATLTPVATRNRDQRRKVLMRSPRLKGLDYVTVERLPRQGSSGGQLWRLHLHFVPSAAGAKSAVPAGINASRIRILLDGKPAPFVHVLDAHAPSLDGDPGAVEVTVETQAQEAYAHDPPVHTLELVEMPDVDPVFSSAPVAFRSDEPAARMVPRFFRDAVPRERTEIDYLAKDFESFRQLMLERMAFYIPQWQERNPADLGVTVVEVLAYAADYLSYYQDAVATEAYLDTSRRRISVRRHTRLLDFRLDEGTNARVWVHVQVAYAAGAEAGFGETEGPPPGFVLPAGTQLFTVASRVPACVLAGSREHLRALEQDPMIFQTMVPVVIYPEHNELDVYTWGAEDYTLARGATSASLRGHFGQLAAGDVLVIEKRVGPGAGGAGGRATDPRERQAVRLSRPPVLSRDPLTREIVTEIAWFDEDALRADFPISRTVGRVRQERLSLVIGNIVLADHGVTIEDLLPAVPVRGAYDPVLPHAGLTFRVPFDAVAARREAAVRAVQQDGWEAAPDVELFEVPAHLAAGSVEEARARIEPWHPRWRPQYDLLNSSRFARDFAVEVDDHGRAHLRFGNGEAGRRPAPGSRFLARYRIGLGPGGNVGPSSVGHIVLAAETLQQLAERDLVIAGVRNYLPGMGGNRQTPAASAQIYAPDIVASRAFQLRCVTDEDCAELAVRHPEVLRAVSRRRWAGSAHVILLYVQRRGGLPLDAAFEARLRRYLEPCLLAGWDLVIREPLYVPLDIQMTVVLQPGLKTETAYQRFFQEILQPGKRLFDPDDLTFGESVYVSKITALIMSVPGVADVKADVFQRWGQPPGDEMAAGRIAIGPLEIARLDNDPAAPQHGTFKVRIEEG